MIMKNGTSVHRVYESVEATNRIPERFRDGFRNCLCAAAGMRNSMGGYRDRRTLS